MEGKLQNLEKPSGWGGDLLKPAWSSKHHLPSTPFPVPNPQKLQPRRVPGIGSGSGDPPGLEDYAEGEFQDLLLVWLTTAAQPFPIYTLVTLSAFLDLLRALLPLPPIDSIF